MVNMFKRSLSFPNKIPSRGSPAKPAMSHHIRSISLPCSRSHPVTSQLRDEVNELNACSSTSTRTLSWLCDALTRLKQVHHSLDDFLHLPHTQDSLRRHTHYVDNALEHFLLFVDAFGIFHTSLVALKEHHSAAQVAIRRRDDSKLALYLKARNSFAKDIEKLLPGINGRPPTTGSVDEEVLTVINEVVEATRVASRAVFDGISASYGRKSSWKSTRRGWEIEELRQVGAERLRGMKNKGEEEVRMVSMRMRDLENCIVELQNGSERVFRGLITARVSLLNCLTH